MRAPIKLRLVSAEVEIIRIEAAEAFEGRNIEDFHTASAEGDEFLPAKVL